MLESQKRANKKWREENPEKMAEIQRRICLNYYYRNKEEILKRQRAKYHEKKERLRLEKMQQIMEEEKKLAEQLKNAEI